MENFKELRMRELVDELNACNKAYYVDNAPLISDYEFDMKLKALESLEKDAGFSLPDSPTQRVGSDLQKGFKDVSRKRIMGSIANCYEMAELRKWYEALPSGAEIIVEPKYDGLSCSLIYVNGILAQASTRGNGFTGADVTANVREIKSVPKFLPAWNSLADFQGDGVLEVRGEVLMPKSEFLRINKERVAKGQEPFANERNAASGSLKQLDPKVTAERNLIFKSYAAYSNVREISGKYLKTQSDMLDFTAIMGFGKPDYWKISNPTKTASADFAIVEAIIRDFERDFLEQCDFHMDGAVIKVNDFSLQEEMGYSQKVPYWAKAFKFKQENVSTKLTDVQWFVGRTGKLSPVGILAPVEVDGTIIKQVTLNNIDYINNMNIQIGSYIFIERGGQVIPKVTGVDYERNLLNNIELM